MESPRVRDASPRCRGDGEGHLKEEMERDPTGETQLAALLVDWHDPWACLRGQVVRGSTWETSKSCQTQCSPGSSVRLLGLKSCLLSPILGGTKYLGQVCKPQFPISKMDATGSSDLLRRW